MATVVMVDTPGTTAEQYEATLNELGLDKSLPDGCTVHIAGPSPDGSAWRVITVWDDMTKAQEFVADKLRPAQERIGIQQPAAPPQMWPLHSLVV